MVTAPGPSPIRLGFLGQDSFDYGDNPILAFSNYLLVRDSGSFGQAGGWHLDTFSPPGTLTGAYQNFSWDGIGSAVFFRTLGFGPLLITVTLGT